MCWINSYRAFFITALFLGANTASAEEQTTSNEDEWNYLASFYLWGADLKGTANNGAKIDISFSDLVDNLEMAFMGGLVANKGKWSFATDIIYLDVSSTDKNSGIVPLKTTVDLSGTVLQFVGGYRVHDEDGYRINLVAGTRYLDLSTDIKANLLVPPNTTVKISESDYTWDVIVGVRGLYTVNERWSIPYYVDMGTGDSDKTYHLSTGFNYRTSDTLNIAFRYRYLDWEFDSHDLLKDISFKGPLLGITYNF